MNIKQLIFFSFLLFFISAITSIKNNFKEVFKDSWNLSFLFSGIFLTIISFTHSEQIDPLNGDWDEYLSFIGLFKRLNFNKSLVS